METVESLRVFDRFDHTKRLGPLIAHIVNPTSAQHANHKKKKKRFSLLLLLKNSFVISLPILFFTFFFFGGNNFFPFLDYSSSFCGEKSLQVWRGGNNNQITGR
jgi:hypothetical protein